MHVTLTPQIATLLDSEFAAAELEAVFAQMDATAEKDAPNEDVIRAEVRAFRKEGWRQTT